MGVAELFDLTGKVALVTGSARGLGRAFAEGLAEAGADVVCVDLMEEENKVTADLVKKQGRKAMALKVNITDEAEVEGMIKQTIDSFGKLDILVNNAGVSGAPGPVHAQPLEEWNKVIAVDLTGVFLCSKFAVGAMLNQKSGKIINIASVQGLVGATPNLSPPFPAYCAAKGGVVNLTREMAVEYAPAGINVNCIAPAPFETEIVGPFMKDPRFLALMKNTFPLRDGIGKPADLKGSIIFLASKAADYISGHILVVDQGFLAH